MSDLLVWLAGFNFGWLAVAGLPSRGLEQLLKLLGSAAAAPLKPS